VLLNPVTLLRRHFDYGAIEGLLYCDGGFHLHEAQFGTKLLPMRFSTPQFAR